MRARHGFALLAALWVVAGLSAMALTGLLIARGVVAGAHNRVALMRGRWRAEDCLERARAVIDEALVTGGGWELIDHAVAASPAITDAHCDVSLVPAGIAVDVNAAGAEQLGLLLRAVGIAPAKVDSMIAALLSPRAGPLADVRQLRRLRGFDAATLQDSVLYALFAVEPGRIVWNRAPLIVLASIPGMGEEALARMAQRRMSAMELSASLSPSARAQFNARYADIQRLTTDRPDAWILTARSGGATIEVRLAPAGTRAAIVRRRTTP